MTTTAVTPSRRRRRCGITLAAIAALVSAVGASGCLIDDSPAGRGGAPSRSASPTASVPDAGSPVRRESAARTLNEADPAPSGAAESPLDIDPAGRNGMPAPPTPAGGSGTGDER